LLSALGAPLAVNSLPVPAALFDAGLRCLGANRQLAALLGGAGAPGPEGEVEILLRPLVEALEGNLRRVLRENIVERLPIRGELLGAAHVGRSLDASLWPVLEEGAVCGVMLWLAGPPAGGREAPATHLTRLPDVQRTADAFERLLNGVPHPMLVKDRAHRFLVLNDAMCALLGRPREELLGRTDHDFLPQEQADGYCALDDEVFATGEEREVEEEFTTSDGSVRVLRTRKGLVRLPGPKGEEDFLILSTIDITPIQAAEAALRESEAAFRQLFHSNPAPMWVYDAETLRFLEVNDAAVQVYGWSRDAFLGMTILDIRPAEERERVRRSVAEPRSARKASGPWRHVDAAGRERLVDVISYATRFAGRPGVLVTAWDVTDRVRAEEALRESEENYRYTIELSPQIPWTASPDGMILGSGPRWREITGLASEEALGMGWVRALHPEDAEATLRAWEHSLRTGEPCDVEYRLLTKDGTYRWFRASAAARRDAEGRIIRWYGMLEDIDARKQVEMALRESEEHYRYTIELSPQYPWTTDGEGRNIHTSSRWLTTFGQTAEETRGTGWMGVVHPEDLPLVQAAYRAMLVTGESYDCECRFRLADGSYRWFRSRGAPRRDAEGRIIRWYGSTEDVHDRKLAEMALRESEMRFRTMADDAPVAIWVADPSGAATFVSRLWYETTGQTEAQALGLGWLEAVHPEDREEVTRAFAAARTQQALFRIEYRLRRHDGTWRWVIDAAQPRFAPDGSFLGYVGSVLDITEARLASERIKQARREAESAAARLSSVLESTMDGVVVLDRQWRVTYLNRNASRMLGDRKPALGMSLWEAFPEEEDGVFAARYREAMAGQLPVGFEAHLSSLGLWLEVQAYPTPDGLSIFFRDVTERRRAEQERLLAQEKIAHMARYDALTGLPNRLLLREVLERKLRLARGGDRSGGVAVLSLDLDGFKGVNDTLGLPAGDALLRLVADRLRSGLREAELVARPAGDEFAIVQGQVERKEQAEALANRVLELLAEPFEVEGQQVGIGASIGVAVFPDDVAGCVDDLLKAAGIALYRAKAEERGTHRLFEPGMDKRLEQHHAIRRALPGALARGEFELHYQPLIQLHSGRVSGFEALLRWHCPGRGMVPPAEFIPVAEESGFITAIGDWVIQEACRTVAGWPGKVSVAVNLSPVQFRGRTLVATVARTLAETGLDPARLQLEITESVLLHDSAANLAMLKELRELGVRIAMDDFGTGYSSLNYLRSFPFDKIKLDRSFVADVPHRPEANAIVHAVAGLASGLGVTCTAEGIETCDQFRALRAAGYNEGQGFLFSGAVPAAEARLMLDGPRAEELMAKVRRGRWRRR
jgi:diguanylate cyclase (GGDEF)-like protein/PAS domain S-box-containing protein